MDASPRYDPGSFRDRSSRVFCYKGGIYRGLSAAALADWEFVSTRDFLKTFLAERSFIESWLVDPAGLPESDDFQWAGVLKHARVPFISYPYEWSFHMLQDAALLHLALISEGLKEETILKDATPYNTQFRGARCVFIDVASLVRYEAGDVWRGYRQFCQTMLYPLMLQAYHGVDFQPWLRGRLEGISPDECRRLFSTRDLFRRGVFSHVFLHAKMEQHAGSRPQGMAESLKNEGFGQELIQNNVRKLTRLVESLRWSADWSTWSEYDQADSPAQVDGTAKEEFVREVVQTRRWREVWDLGCNLGRYSRIAARHADLVLALDADHLAIDRLYLSLREEQNERILPLVFNLADPSPGLGWRGCERPELTQRGRPELVLALAVIHHLVMRENILLPDLIDWLGDLGGSLVIEFVDKHDPLVQLLLANRTDQYEDYSQAAFEHFLSRRFIVRRRQLLPSGTRSLYHVDPITSG